MNITLIRCERNFPKVAKDLVKTDQMKPAFLTLIELLSLLQYSRHRQAKINDINLRLMAHQSLILVTIKLAHTNST